MLPSKSDHPAPVRSAGRAKLPDSPRLRLQRRLPWLFSPLAWMRQLLRRPLRLERRGLNVHIVLGDPPARAADEERGQGAGEALRRAHGELRELLRRHPDAPKLLRHLAFIERALRKEGSFAIRELPLTVLHRGLAQLHSVARDEKGAGLEELKRRLGREIQRRTSDPADTVTDTRPDELHVSEASHSLFEEMERSWTGQIPVDPRAAAAG